MSATRGEAVRRWNGFWYGPASALNLAAARVVFATHALWILGSRDLAAISGVPEVFWAGAPLSLRWRYLLFPGHLALEQSLQAAALVALLAAALGIWPRVACFAAGLLLYHLAPLETIFWYPQPFERGLTISVLALLTLSFSRCGDALAVVPRSRTPAPASGEYQWPLRLLQLFVCQIYFISGWAKLVRAGPAWVSGDTIRAWLLVFAQEDQVLVPGGIGLWLAERPLACWLAAVAAVLLDFGMITLVLWPKLRSWLIPAALAFHVGILFAMGIVFLNLPQLLVFVDWAAWRERRQSAAADRAQLEPGFLETTTETGKPPGIVHSG